MKPTIPSLAFAGRHNLDVTWIPQSIRYHGDRVELVFPSTSVTIHTYQVPVPGSKCFAQMPSDPLRFAADLKNGGGLQNTALAYRSISHRVARLLSSVEPDEQLLREIEYLRMDARYLNFAPRPCNIVVVPDRTIFKPRPPALAEWDATRQEAVEWAAQTRIVAANSIGEEAVMTALTRAVERAGTKLFAMVTPALPAAAIRRAIPGCAGIFAAIDEIPRVFGEEFAPNYQGALRAIEDAHALNPDAAVFITLGKAGVLVAEAGTAPVLVRLRPEVVTEVQEHFRRHPGCDCGCGDAFFAGAIAWYADRETLAGGLSGGPESGLCAAISGCAAAIRWAGFQPRLKRDDFEIVEHFGEDYPRWTAAA